MKLYTEEQVKYILDLAQRSGVHIAKISVDVDKKLIPIELPSDEEIENYARQSGLVHPFITRGAKWMREQILKNK